MGIQRGIFRKALLVGLFLSVAVIPARGAGSGSGRRPSDTRGARFCRRPRSHPLCPGSRVPSLRVPGFFRDRQGHYAGPSDHHGQETGGRVPVRRLPHLVRCARSRQAGEGGPSRNPHPDARTRRVSALLQALPVGALRPVRPPKRRRSGNHRGPGFAPPRRCEELRDQYVVGRRASGNPPRGGGGPGDGAYHGCDGTARRVARGVARRRPHRA